MRDRILNFLNRYLRIKDFNDPSLNGLQVEGKEDVKKVLFSVSYCYSAGIKAVEEKADMIIVHHGILWSKVEPITGIFKHRIEPLLKNNINLLAYHLPLDAHPEIGNNISIINFFNPFKIKPFANYKGQNIGFTGILKKTLSIKEITDIIKSKINPVPLIFDYGKKEIKTISVVSGGAASMFIDAIEEKSDLYITGEPSEQVFELAKESKTNFISAGHHRTEVFGVKNLQSLIEKKFKIKTIFFDTNNPV